MRQYHKVLHSYYLQAKRCADNREYVRDHGYKEQQKESYKYPILRAREQQQELDSLLLNINEKLLIITSRKEEDKDDDDDDIVTTASSNILRESNKEEHKVERQLLKLSKQDNQKTIEKAYFLRITQTQKRFKLVSNLFESMYLKMCQIGGVDTIKYSDPEECIRSMISLLSAFYDVFIQDPYTASKHKRHAEIFFNGTGEDMFLLKSLDQNDFNDFIQMLENILQRAVPRLKENTTKPADLLRVMHSNFKDYIPSLLPTQKKLIFKIIMVICRFKLPQMDHYPVLDNLCILIMAMMLSITQDDIPLYPDKIQKLIFERRIAKSGHTLSTFYKYRNWTLDQLELYEKDDHYSFSQLKNLEIHHWRKLNELITKEQTFKYLDATFNVLRL